MTPSSPFHQLATCFTACWYQDLNTKRAVDVRGRDLLAVGRDLAGSPPAGWLTRFTRVLRYEPIWAAVIAASTWASLAHSARW